MAEPVVHSANAAARTPVHAYASAHGASAPGFHLTHIRGAQSARPLVPHFHDEYVICVQLRGHEACHVAGKLYTFDAGEVVLLNPLQVHTGNARGDNGVEYASLYVDPELVRTIAREQTDGEPAPEFVHVKVPDDATLVGELQTLLAWSRARTAASAEETADVDLSLEQDAAAQRVVARALERFSNLGNPRIRSTNRVAHRAVARVVQYLRELDPATDDTSLDALATLADLSKYHFLRQFSRVVGMTPGAYLRTLRMCQASRLLWTTREPIAEVARRTGFRDHASFSRAFRRHAGLSPTQYRARR